MLTYVLTLDLTPQPVISLYNINLDQRPVISNECERSPEFMEIYYGLLPFALRASLRLFKSLPVI